MVLDFIIGLFGLAGMGISGLIDEAQCAYGRQVLEENYAYRLSLGIPKWGLYCDMLRPITPQDRPDVPESKDGKHWGYFYENKWYPDYDFTVETSFYRDRKKSNWEAQVYHINKSRVNRLVYIL